MGKFGGGGGISIPEPAEVAPPRNSPEIDEAAKRQRLSEKRRKGRAATILSRGSDEDAGVVRRPTAAATQKKETLG